MYTNNSPFNNIKFIYCYYIKTPYKLHDYLHFYGYFSIANLLIITKFKSGVQFKMCFQLIKK